MLWRFAQFYWQAKTKYTIHSPFVFEFVQHVLEDDRLFYVFREAELLRGTLLASKDLVEVEDFGAGSTVDGFKKSRRVKAIAHSALSADFQCRWLFRIFQLYKPLNIIELGTSLGVSTLYLAEGSPRAAKVITLEGSPNIAQLARRNFDWYYDTFRKMGFRNNDPEIVNLSKFEENFSTDFEKNKIQIVVGKFDDTLQNVLNQLVTLDVCFIDGNHRREPTLDYFEKCLAHAHQGTILIFDDIHWSEEMEQAWKEIKAHPKVRVTIDMFWCGIVFFRENNHEKEHFQVVKARYKPLSTGLFG